MDVIGPASEAFRNRSFLVTGASSGIGAATASAIAAHGGRVIAIARRADALQKMVDSLPGDGHLPLALDATDSAAVTKAMEGLSGADRSLHGAVFCVGAHMLRPIRITSDKHYGDMFRQHVLSATNFMPAMTKLMADPASIVLVSSAARFRGGSAASAYIAAKNALVGLARAWACELAPRIRVNSVSPGVVRTGSTERFLRAVGPKAAQDIEQRHLLGVGQPHQVAGAITFLLSDQASWITGIDLAVDGGFAIQA